MLSEKSVRVGAESINNGNGFHGEITVIFSIIV